MREMNAEVFQGFSPAVVLGSLFCVAALLTVGLTFLSARIAHRLGAVDRGGYRRINNKPIPRMGGLGVALPVIAGCLLASVGCYLGVLHWQALVRASYSLFLFTFSIADLRKDFAVLAIGSVAILAIGVVDDSRGMKARTKLLGQTAVAIFVCSFGYRVETVPLPWIGSLHLGSVVGFCVSVFWIVFVINAFNLVDGMDGLASGIALIASCAILGVGLLLGDAFMVLACVALAGSLAAFLFFNFPPASIFLGDTGSMFLGFFLSSITLMGSSRLGTALAVGAPLLALAFPLFETSVTMLRRFIHGLPIFAGDDRHTHHRLLRSYSQRTAVILLYIPAIAFALAAVFSQWLFDGSLLIWAPAAAAVAGVVWIIYMADYVSVSTLKGIRVQRQRNLQLNALGRYACLALSAAEEMGRRHQLMRVCCEEMGLEFLTAWFVENEEVIARFDEAASTPFPQPRDSGVDADEQIRVMSHLGFMIAVSFRFAKAPDEQERMAVLRTLARIFENANLEISRATVVSVQPDYARRKSVG